MIADLFEIKEADKKYGKGKFQRKGVFAKQFIPKGTIIYFECKKCRPWKKDELARLSKVELSSVKERSYPIKYCDKILWYNNHSCNANTLDMNNRVSIVVRDIKKGEEQTEDYRIYCQNKLHFKGGCRCGAKDCMKTTTFKQPAPKKLQRLWKRKINMALKLANTVNQPLKKQLLKDHKEMTYLFEHVK
jgi:hypothetical protein